ncbi:SDR family oxidoreductase [Herbaspirillum sp. alder98]|uniref:SDR family oxidoreductase n=1 Tax=Herbaspirillum sp. alder98 TaxID=2913096 RepID=UPI001CD8F480|nr:SDR family oxidoreductase [Herbaspirillum sp. alder98]MCA1323772.1 SDR family oxidoreductase [Herbaspirillum sp. alder98]
MRALTRDARRARRILPSQAQLLEGDVTNPDALAEAVNDVEAIVFTHGASGSGKTGSRSVDYGAVRAALLALNGRPARIALMTAIGVTNRDGQYNRATEAHDWKRRSERLVRASGLRYTIVRPGWFDYNDEDQHKLNLLQGDRRQAGDPSDGVIARQQIADVLVASLSLDAAIGKTFELVAEKGPAQENLGTLLASLAPDVPGALDAVLDMDNMPRRNEPSHVIDDLQAIGNIAPG